MFARTSQGRSHTHVGFLLGFMAAASCNSSGGSPGHGGGGAIQGGKQASGGTSGSGGLATNGGGPAGGAPANAGGGVVPGGAVAGGTTTARSGGATGAGGFSGSGGSIAVGGATYAGGAPGSGGAPNGGGATSVGGVAAGGVSGAGGVATGGAPASGGTTPSLTGHYQMEDLDRGVVAVKVADGVYVGWRMMGYEYNPTSPSSVSYNVYRDGTKVASVTDSTNYLDAAGSATAVYTVTAVINGSEGAQSPKGTTWAQNYLRIPLTPPAAGYEANDGSPGDLDGDGKYEIVLKWMPSNAQDNSLAGDTDNTFLDGIKLDGTRMWRIDLGPNIRSGAHYTQFSVYDFDGDGKAEIACKTAPGTKDGTGSYLHTGPAATDDDSQNYVGSTGYVLSGPEYLTVFDGLTGKELATVNYPVPRGTVSSWGDDYGNRVDRFNGGAAFVSDTGSGKTATGRPSIIQQRGYYTRLTMSAYNWRNGQLSKVWTFDSNGSGNGAAAGQGDHSAMAADVDGDGAQEIITGATTIGSDGTLKCTTGLGHGDAMHVGELVVGKGISVFSVHEGEGGYDVHNGATCATYVKVLDSSTDNGRGVADFISASNTTSAGLWSAAYPDLYSCADGSSLGKKPSAQNFLIYWDADESRELEDATSITKYGGGTLLSASGCAGNNSTKNTPTLTADLLGDWREELVLRESNNSALRIYTTTDVTKRRIYTLMHDPTYRMQVAFEQSSYNQPPHPGFHIGSGMKDPPKPDIYVK